ncbi:MAG: formyltetrahydrofolate deformylase [Candidatus Omnitrophota bacterium]
MHNTFILLFQCSDRKGIVARISDFILKHNGNIINADQHSTDPEGGHFFIRVEFFIKDISLDKKRLEEEFMSLAKDFDAQWQIHDKCHTLRMGVMVSDLDHCLAELLYLWRAKELKVDIPFVISSCSGHRGLVEQYRLPFYHIAADKNDRREEELLKIIEGTTDFLVLARYMLIFSPDFLVRYKKDIINIHHGFLPFFKGRRPYRQVFEQGVKVIGATAHFVTAELDEGPIITQMVEQVSHRDSFSSLVRKGKNLEKLALAKAIESYLDYRVIKYKNKTIIF